MPILHAKIKFEEAMEQVNELRENQIIEVMDRYGRRKTQEINTGDNILKAARVNGMLRGERAHNMFVNMNIGSLGESGQTETRILRFNQKKD